GGDLALEPQPERRDARTRLELALEALQHAPTGEPPVDEHQRRRYPWVPRVEVAAAARLGLEIEAESRSRPASHGGHLPAHPGTGHRAADTIERGRHDDLDQVVAGADVVAECVV